MTDRLKKLFNSAFGTCVRHINHLLLKQAMCTVNWTAVLYNHLHLIITNVTHKTLLPIQITWWPFLKIKSQITLLSGDSQYYSPVKIRAYTILSLTSGNGWCSESSKSLSYSSTIVTCDTKDDFQLATPHFKCFLQTCSYWWIGINWSR